MVEEVFYETRLRQYFDYHYGYFKDHTEFFINPAKNQWLFYITYFDKKILLTCDTDGYITETREDVVK